MQWPATLRFVKDHTADDRMHHMDKLMILEEVAEYLRLSKDTIYRMAHTAKIPASKVGNQWRFRKEDLDQWIERNKNVRRKAPQKEG
jgi:excisionase family DNA binding protein